MTEITYARARLWTGITSVGTVVVCATLLLLTQAPQRFLPGEALPALSEAGWILLVFALGALIALPFDVLGGYVLPSKHGRPAPSPGAFVRSWLRGVSVLTLLSVCLLYTSPSPRDATLSRMPSSA